MLLTPTPEIRQLLARDRVDRLHSSMSRHPVSARRRLGALLVSAGVRLDPSSAPAARILPARDHSADPGAASCALADAA